MGLVAKAFQDIITFSRASSGTYVNSNGYITNSSVLNYLTYSNQPENAAWTKSNSFVQQNLLTYSEDITNAAWLMLGTAGGSRAADETISPNGTLTADRYSVGTGTGVWYIANYAGPSLISGQSYTFSVYLKANGYNFAFIRPHNNSANFGASGFIVNLTDGTITYPSSPTAPASTGTATNIGNGWWRVTATSTANLTATPSGGPGIWPRPNNSFSDASGTTAQNFTGDGVSGVYIWGAQFVQGSVPGDYRATTSAALPCLYADYNGALRARKLCENSGAAATHTVNQIANSAVGATVTFSYYLKQGERVWALLYTSAGQGKSFSLATGTLGGDFIAAPAGSSITPLGNGWYRCSITVVAIASTTTCFAYTADADTSGFYAGNGSSGIYIADAQLNDGSSALAYYDTTASAYNAPRFDYDPVTLAAKGLLVEESRANLLLNSVFAGTGAAPTSFTQPIATGTSAPATSTRSGISAAYSQSATAQRPFIEQVVTTVAATVYTVSMNIEAVSGLTYNDIIGVSGLTPSVFRLNGATVLGTDTAATGKIEAVVTASGVSSSCRFGIGTSGNATGTLRFSCPQIEAGAFATSYIPTVASQVTRAADVASVNTLSPWFNSVAGTLYVEALANAASPSNQYLATINDGTTNNRVTLFKSTAGAANSRYTAGGVANHPTSLGSSIAGIISKTAITYSTAASGVNIYSNGTAGTAVTAAATPTGMLRLGLGIDETGATAFINAHLRRVTYYPRQMTSAEGVALTTL